jgi:plasmid maintenance system antidote protein VapI
MESKELKAILHGRGIKQTWVASKLKVSKQLVNQWVSGTATISESHQIELRKLLVN